jgi:hypothetical protein
LRIHRARKHGGDLLNGFGRGNANAFAALRVQSNALKLSIHRFTAAMHNDQTTRMQLVHACECIEDLRELRCIIKESAAKFDNEWGAHYERTSSAVAVAVAVALAWERACVRRAIPSAVVSSNPNRRFMH